MKVMKIKNILFLLALALPALVLTSCQSEEDDAFNESSSLRLQQAMNEAKNVLRSAQYGWVMDYYIGDDQQYGGRAMTVKFDSLTCTVASESMPRECTSYYKMSTDQGPVLTFDTYNEVLHELSTPSSTNYEGYHADFEFVVESATPELVVLRGKRIGNYAYLHPLTEAPLDYLAKVNAMRDSIYVATADGMIGSDSVSASFDYDSRTVTFNYTNNSVDEQVPVAFTYTDSGIRLYDDVDVNGTTLSEFAYNGNGMTFSGINAGANNFAMTGSVPDDYVSFEKFAGDYRLLYYVPGNNNDMVESTIDVTLTPSQDGTSYNMSGLNPNFEVVLHFNRQAGRLEWNTQAVGQQGSNIIWLNAMNWASGGNLFPAYTGCGMVTVWNGDSENPVYNWVTNSDVNQTTDSFCFWLTDSSGESLGQFTEWGVNGYVLMLNITSMTKLN